MLAAKSISKLATSLLLCLPLSATYGQSSSLLQLCDPVQLLLGSHHTTDSIAQQGKVTATLMQTRRIDEMPIFCKMEERIGAAAQTMVRLRLGSADYVDYLEGKRLSPP